MPSPSVSKPAGRDVSGVARSARHSVPSLLLLLKGSSAHATMRPVPARVSLASRASTTPRLHQRAPAYITTRSNAAVAVSLTSPETGRMRAVLLPAATFLALPPAKGLPRNKPWLKVSEATRSALGRQLQPMGEQLRASIDPAQNVGLLL